MQMIFGATCRENVDILGVGERGHVAPEFLRLANQVLPLFGAEHAMQEIMRVGVRHEFESSQLLPQNAVTVRTSRCLGLSPLRGSGVSEFQGTYHPAFHAGLDYYAPQSGAQGDNRRSTRVATPL